MVGPGDMAWGGQFMGRPGSVGNGTVAGQVDMELTGGEMARTQKRRPNAGSVREEQKQGETLRVTAERNNSGVASKCVRPHLHCAGAGLDGKLRRAFKRKR